MILLNDLMVFLYQKDLIQALLFPIIILYYQLIYLVLNYLILSYKVVSESESELFNLNLVHS